MRGDRPLHSTCLLKARAFTPHARGSTCAERCRLHRGTVYPACAGIDRELHRCVPSNKRLPRMRGDRPCFFSFFFTPFAFTPHARGSTVLWPPRRYGRTVYPACAGIDRLCHRPAGWASRLPRMRGDRPLTLPKAGNKKGVYPACAGIDRHP